MPALPELQRGFAAAIFGEGDAPFVDHVRDGRFPGARLVQIYRNNTFASLTAALEAVYPVVVRLVGDGFFRYAADTYIHAHPSTSGNLHDFGGRFGAFLATFPAAASLPYLPDVARLEWAYHRVFHAADHPPLALAQLAAVPPAQHGQLVFGLHPATRLLESDYPVLRIWQANQPGAADEHVDLDTGGDRLLVFRRALDIEFKRLSAGELRLLRAFSVERRFAEASTAALEAEAQLDLGEILRQHVALGTVASFRLDLSYA
jgi:hypothetical protein